MDHTQGQKRCKRCRLFLNDREFSSSKCYHHPGKFTPADGWSCCSSTLNPKIDFNGFFATQALMPPMPRAPTMNEYLHDAALSAVEYARIGTDSSATSPMIGESSKFTPSLIGRVETTLFTPSSDYVSSSSDYELSSAPAFSSLSSSSLFTPSTQSDSHTYQKAPTQEIIPVGKPDSTLAILHDRPMTYAYKQEVIRQLDNSLMSSYVEKFNQKEDHKTMSWNEREKTRHDPQLSPLVFESIGCTISEQHAEDALFSATLNNFPIRAEVTEHVQTRPLPQQILASRLDDTRHPLPEDLIYVAPKSPTPATKSETPRESSKEETPREETPREETPGEETPKEIPEFFTHTVQNGDTLVGLSLKYDVPVDVLQRVNFLSGSRHSLFYLKTIKIPTNGRVYIQHVLKPTKSDLVKSFTGKTGISSEEAKFYLLESDWDLDLALEEHKKDAEWESQNQAKLKKSVPHQPPQMMKRQTPRDAVKPKSCFGGLVSKPVKSAT